MDDKKNTQKQNPVFMREVRCPVHNLLIGRYDARDGLINATFYCPKCGREYTFTIKREQNSLHIAKSLDFVPRIE